MCRELGHVIFESPVLPLLSVRMDAMNWSWTVSANSVAFLALLEKGSYASLHDTNSSFIPPNHILYSLVLSHLSTNTSMKAAAHYKLMTLQFSCNQNI